MLNGLTIVASAFIYQHDNSTTKQINCSSWQRHLSVCVCALMLACVYVDLRRKPRASEREKREYIWISRGKAAAAACRKKVESHLNFFFRSLCYIALSLVMNLLGVWKGVGGFIETYKSTHTPHSNAIWCMKLCVKWMALDGAYVQKYCIQMVVLRWENGIFPFFLWIIIIKNSLT